MNEQNLIPCSERSKSEVREIGAKGGIASGAARREKKRLIDAINEWMSQPTKEGSKFTRLEAIAGKLCEKLYNDPEWRDAKIFTEMNGELTTKIEASTPILQINAPTQEGANIIQSAIDEFNSNSGKDS